MINSTAMAIHESLFFSAYDCCRDEEKGKVWCFGFDWTTTIPSSQTQLMAAIYNTIGVILGLESVLVLDINCNPIIIA